MPLLDVNDLLVDPDFADTFNVIRRKEVPGENGVMTLQETTYRNIIGVVTAASPSDLDRKEDYATMTRSISVVTSFRVQGLVTGYQPDLIEWNGTRHVVKNVQPYTRFGRGFVEVECGSMANTDTPS